MSLLRHYFSDTKRVRQRCKMLQFEFVPVLCLIFGLLVQSPKIVKADPQHGVAFPDGKTFLIYFLEEKNQYENLVCFCQTLAYIRSFYKQSPKIVNADPEMVRLFFFQAKSVW